MGTPELTVGWCGLQSNKSRLSMALSLGPEKGDSDKEPTPSGCRFQSHKVTAGSTAMIRSIHMRLPEDGLTVSTRSNAAKEWCKVREHTIRARATAGTRAQNATNDFSQWSMFYDW